MSKIILKLTLLTFIYLCSSQNSWSTVDSTRVKALTMTSTTCNTDFFSALTPATSTYVASLMGVRMNFTTPTNMCPNINYTVDVAYTYMGSNCGSNNCCGFADILATNARAVTSSNPCFTSTPIMGVTAPFVTFYKHITWNPTTDGTIQPLNLFTTGSSDRAYFISGYIHIHR